MPIPAWITLNKLTGTRRIQGSNVTSAFGGLELAAYKIVGVLGQVFFFIIDYWHALSDKWVTLAGLHLPHFKDIP